MVRPSDGSRKPSSTDRSTQTLQLEYAFGKDATHNDYHVHVIRTQLTRSLIPLFPDIYDEIARSFNDLIPPSSEWVKVPVVRTMMQVVSRVSNRIFVGLPLCTSLSYYVCSRSSHRLRS